MKKVLQAYFSNQNSSQHFSIQLLSRVERVHDLWILRHVVLMEVESWGSLNVYSIDKLSLKECRRVFNCPRFNYDLKISMQIRTSVT